MKSARRIGFHLMLLLMLTSCEQCSERDRTRWWSPDDNPLEVTSNTPDGNTDSLMPIVTALFNHVMDPATMLPGRLHLSGAAGDVPGVVTPDFTPGGQCRGVSFTPDSPLTAGECYTARVTTAILDDAGVGLEDDHAWTFCVEAEPLFAWREPVTFTNIDLDRGGILATVDVDPYRHRAIVGWLAPIVLGDLSTTYELWYREVHLDAEMFNSVWGSTRQRETNLRDLAAPHVSCSVSGDGVLLAAVHDAILDRHMLRLRKYVSIDTSSTNSIDWKAADNVGEGAEPIGSLRAVVDVWGGTLAVLAMTEQGQTRSAIYTLDLTVTQDPTSPDLLERLPDADVARPRLARNAAGNGIVVWEVEDDAGDYRLRGAQYLRGGPGTGWIWTGSLDETAFEGVAVDPDVALDVGDNAFVVWAREGATVRSVHAVRFPLGGGAPPAPFSLSAGLVGEARSPRVVVFPNGIAIAVWVQKTGVLSESLMAMRYVPGEGWRDRAVIHSAPHVEQPHMAATPSGRAIVVWHDVENVFAAHLLGGTAWSTAEAISRQGDISIDLVENPRVAMDGEGRAIVVWQQMDYRWTIRGALYR